MGQELAMAIEVMIEAMQTMKEEIEELVADRDFWENKAIALADKMAKAEYGEEQGHDYTEKNFGGYKGNIY
jgi:hypothetical protein